MCGISGIAHFNGCPVEQDNIALMVESIKHRGPDGQGVWFNNKQNVAFGHTRLSILDLSIAGKQPMSYLDHRYNITMNGEIYNFIEIRRELKSKNYLFKTETDGVKICYLASMACGLLQYMMLLMIHYFFRVTGMVLNLSIII
jgi:asparagine synthase (glutamine-hydrolysing)